MRLSLQNRLNPVSRARSAMSARGCGVVIAALIGGIVVGADAPIAFAADGKTAVLTDKASVGDRKAPKSLLGNYLAGRVARTENDLEAAADFYGSALSRDPANEQLLIQSFDMELMEGRWTRALALAEKVAALKSDHRLARVLLGLKEFKADRYDAAEAHFTAAAVNPVGELTANLARAWTRLAAGNRQQALELLDQPKAPDWAQLFYRYHRALLNDVAGQAQDARAAYERMYKADGKSLRTTLAYAQHLSNSGDARMALAALKPQLDKTRGEPHPMARTLAQQIEAGDVSQLLVSNASEGLSEVFYGIGEALAGEGGVGPGAMFLQFSLFMQPKQPFALATLANVYESTKKYERAIDIYGRIPTDTALATAIDIRKAINLSALERNEEAQKLLEDVAKRDPSDLKPLDALGSLMRGQKRFDDAVTYYSRAIDLIGKPDARHWPYFYSRGTSYERLKRWPEAEADLQMALKLSPEQAIILNYLGYSWVDQGRNLKQGVALIEKAVRLKPDDGYIVDSLGWAHYRQNNFKDAVKFLERAVELKPEDPVLNDHLGDAYWRVGREREARFQWEQSLTLKPEAEDQDKIQKKLKDGLPALTAPKVQRQAQKTQPTAPQKRPTVARPQPAASPLFE